MKLQQTYNKHRKKLLTFKRPQIVKDLQQENLTTTANP